MDSLVRTLLILYAPVHLAALLQSIPSLQIITCPSTTMLKPAIAIWAFLPASLQPMCSCLYSPILFQSTIYGISNNIPCPKIVAPGKYFGTVWYVDQISHMSSFKKLLTAYGSTESTMSNSEVQHHIYYLMYSLRYRICLYILNLKLGSTA